MSIICRTRTVSRPSSAHERQANQTERWPRICRSHNSLETIIWVARRTALCPWSANLTVNSAITMKIGPHWVKSQRAVCMPEIHPGSSQMHQVRTVRQPGYLHLTHNSSDNKISRWGTALRTPSISSSMSLQSSKKSK